MKLYLVIVEDRHTDVMVYPYRNLKAALKRAKDEALAGGDQDEDQLVEHEIPEWLYYCTYSCEGDSVRVIESEVYK